MRPLKSAEGISKWLLRLSLAAVIFNMSFEKFITFSFQDKTYYIHLLFMLFGLLFLIGGFTKRHSLTILSSLFLIVLFVFMMSLGGFGKHVIISNLAYASIALFFLARGNK